MSVQVMEKRKSIWQLQEAKAMFSELIKTALLRPQIITVRGKETAVILSFKEYKKLTRPGKTFYEFIQSSPLRDFPLELPARESEKMREVSL